MSSETSTESAPFTAGHFYVLLSMVAATAAVVMARNTHPAALLLLSGAALASGYTAYALHQALLGLLSQSRRPVLGARQREVLEQDKNTVLRAIKDLEFDYGMKKVSEADYEDMLGRLKQRALLIMEQLERIPDDPPAPTVGAKASRDLACPTCQTRNDRDAKFCKQCGDRLGSVHV
ncbi:MAG: zinc ribbon domain-containing protein [Acidobacteria bacterium]|nr:zinc ribbon domain-containing protein [Acidobacteriota bacterium]